MEPGFKPRLSDPTHFLVPTASLFVDEERQQTIKAPLTYVIELSLNKLNFIATRLAKMIHSLIEIDNIHSTHHYIGI